MKAPICSRVSTVISVVLLITAALYMMQFWQGTKRVSKFAATHWMVSGRVVDVLNNPVSFASGEVTFLGDVTVMKRMRGTGPRTLHETNILTDADGRFWIEGRGRSILMFWKTDLHGGKLLHIKVDSPQPNINTNLEVKLGLEESE
jgi:hypothetical protein